MTTSQPPDICLIPNYKSAPNCALGSVLITSDSKANKSRLDFYSNRKLNISSHLHKYPDWNKTENTSEEQVPPKNTRQLWMLNKIGENLGYKRIAIMLYICFHKMHKYKANHGYVLLVFTESLVSTPAQPYTCCTPPFHRTFYSPGKSSDWDRCASWCAPPWPLQCETPCHTRYTWGDEIQTMFPRATKNW